MDKNECLSRNELDAIKLKRLQDTVRRVYDNVELYRNKMDAAGIRPEDIKTLDDLKKLPFTKKTDLRDTYPYGMFATPMSEVVRIHASSGTTGKRTVVGYTKNDIEMWSQCTGRAITAAGGTKGDFLHISYGYGLFTGGLGLHYGGEYVGCAVIPASTGNTKRQIEILMDFGSSIICCTPSYALYLGETLEKMGISPDRIPLKAGIFGGEPWTNEMRKVIESKLGIKAFDIYGLSEIMGPGVSFECDRHEGLHISEDHFIPEIIDPDTGEVLPYGERGELVFTCVTKEALPLIRYRTGDITSLIAEPCSCGRTLIRMNKPVGRSDDMLIIRGVNVFPTQVESALLELGYTSPYYLLVVDRKGALDTLEIVVEVGAEMFSDEVAKLEETAGKIRRAVESVIGIAAEIKLVPPNTLERTEGKAVHIDDRRKLVD